MRSVFAYLAGTTRAEVEALLDAAFPGHRNPWILHVRGDPCLYIHVDGDGADVRRLLEEDPAEWSKLVAALEGENMIAVTADVSGRHAGDHEVRVFERVLLGRFRGVASDDNGEYWSLKEIEEGGTKNGKPFFHSGQD